MSSIATDSYKMPFVSDDVQYQKDSLSKFGNHVVHNSIIVILLTISMSKNL